MEGSKSDRGGVKCSGGGDDFRQLGLVASNGFTSCRNYRWDILVAFWPKHGLRSDLKGPNLKVFLGEHPVYLVHTYACTCPSSQQPYQSKIAGSGPILSLVVSISDFETVF